jgi:hypothetical protein
MGGADRGARRSKNEEVPCGQPSISQGPLWRMLRLRIQREYNGLDDEK